MILKKPLLASLRVIKVIVEYSRVALKLQQNLRRSPPIIQKYRAQQIAMKSNVHSGYHC